MEPDKLKAAIDEYLIANNTCALATGAGDFVRCTPVEYGYHHDAFWIFTEGGRKFAALEQNKNVCLAVYNGYDGFGGLKSVQVSGVAQIIEPFSEEYEQAASEKNISLDALRKLESPLHLIKIVPTCMEFLCSDLKKQGFSNRQKLEC